MQGTPHRLVAGVLNGVIDGLKGAGASIMGGLDKPPTSLGGPQGVHHIPGRFADGVAESTRVGFEGMWKALDQPPEQFGIPPDLGGGVRGGIRGPWAGWRR